MHWNCTRIRLLWMDIWRDIDTLILFTMHTLISAYVTCKLCMHTYNWNVKKSSRRISTESHSYLTIIDLSYNDTCMKNTCLKYGPHWIMYSIDVIKLAAWMTFQSIVISSHSIYHLRIVRPNYFIVQATST